MCNLNHLENPIIIKGQNLCWFRLAFIKDQRVACRKITVLFFPFSCSSWWCNFGSQLQPRRCISWGLFWIIFMQQVGGYMHTKPLKTKPTSRHDFLARVVTTLWFICYYTFTAIDFFLHKGGYLFAHFLDMPTPGLTRLSTE